MDIFFRDSSEIPLPPEDVRILQLRADPWPDGRRVRVLIEITPFQKRPSGELNVIDAQGNEVANLTFIETINPKMELTLHLRFPNPQGRFSVNAKLFYNQTDLEGESEDLPQIDPKESTFSKKIRIVDQTETIFEIHESPG
jgi:hypothetical protein